jgi:hypothetical protein
MDLLHVPFGFVALRVLRVVTDEFSPGWGLPARIPLLRHLRQREVIHTCIVNICIVQLMTYTSYCYNQ